MHWNLEKVIDYCGEYGPAILCIASIALLLQNKVLCITYLLGYIINQGCNKILKSIVQEPRPSTILHQFTIGGKERYVDLTGLQEERFGMPSGHAQTIWYSTVFIHLALHNVYITGLYTMTALLTMMERVKYSNHTVSQVFVGAFLGSLFGYGWYRYMT